ncbi:hypothetical protein EYZ11_010387 [Aspergillus tanneri]|uniref:Uncharacterized protein n=1 Tax=Aspergillus tanneri TaxID=1220188 RepID=A0A4S3J5I4_9EURO|nr:hypothetical protein EYZ11_010387 [Aspergillus tanneri]
MSLSLGQKPSWYLKRWFTPELKSQQLEVHRARRRRQDSCAAMGPAHSTSMALFENMRQKRRARTRAIEMAKSIHWREFLDKAGEGHLWKAATYMKPRNSFSTNPLLTVGTDKLTDNKDKAILLTELFLPKIVEAQEELVPPADEIPWESITELGIY